MCGIVGKIGQGPALSFLLDGLSRLEYRGYDSAGVAVLSDSALSVVKSAGRLSVLREKVSEGSLSGTVGIGHTRWATHGAPTDRNAHPHKSGDGRFAIVHNGIIENHMELREELEAKGYRFQSETDTEVIAHLLSAETTEDAVLTLRRVLGRLSGSFALAVLDRDHPDTLLCARRDSPLVLGFGQEELYLASDIPALLPYTREVSFLEDGELAVLQRDGVTVYDSEGRRIEKEKTHINWSIEAAERGGFSHYMEKELFEVPRVLGDTLKRDRFSFETKPAWVHIVACGSAYHAGLLGKHAIEEMTRIPVSVDLASEYRYRNPIIPSNTLVVVISQSGETADTLAALREAKRRGAETLGIVNVVGSTIAREADVVFYTQAGPEIAVATTKAYSAQLLALYRLALTLAESPVPDELIKIPDGVEETFSLRESIQELAKKLSSSEHIFYIGRGADAAIAQEGALKLKEISYIHAEAYAAGELKHGTLSLIEEGTFVVAICTDPFLAPKMLSNIREVQSRGGVVVAITQPDFEEIRDGADACLCIPKTDPRFAALPVATVLQLLAYETARARGCDIDKPRNLAKSVTVE